jgi:chitinase
MLTGTLMRTAGFILALLLILGTVARAELRVVAYVPNWVDVEKFAPTIDYAKLTHINVAFENPRNDTGDLSFNPKNLALITRAHTNGVKILVSIGGGAASGNATLLKRYALLLNPTNRPAFVAKLADYVVTHGFDGLDVDIEGPGIGPDYGAFIEDLAPALRAKGKLLTAALSKGYGGDQVPDAALTRFDFVNIMAYDGAGPWSPQSPGQHSSYTFATNNVAYWLGRGLAASNAVLGVPFYGYGFGEAFRKRDYSYQELVATYPDAAQTDQVGTTIWYNGLPTIRAKAEFVRAQALGGIMIWSLDYDVPGTNSLVTAIYETLHRKPGAASSE